jgi:hypothetical protein
VQLYRLFVYGWVPKSESNLPRWTKAFYTTATPSLNSFDWKQIATLPSDYNITDFKKLHVDSGVPVPTDYYGKHFKTTKTLPAALNMKENIRKPVRKAGPQANHRSAAATIWAVSHSPSTFSEAPLAWSGWVSNQSSVKNKLQAIVVDKYCLLCFLKFSCYTRG